MKTIIIGGGASGASCATRLRRLDEKMEIIILEKTMEVSIANCGLPYFISDVIPNRENILISNPQKFKSWFNIDVRLNSEVIEINREEKYVILQNNEKLNYDKLVIATGAKPIIPNIEGLDLSKTYILRTLKDAEDIKKQIKENNMKNIIITGGGFIGIELAENLANMGLNISLIEASSHILSLADEELTTIAEKKLIEKNINLILSDKIDHIENNKAILSSNNEINYDLIIMAIGVRPELDLVIKSNLEISRGIIVDDYLQTKDPSIYACGDNIEAKDFISGTNSLFPLAGPANRQGRIVADNICGYSSTYKKTLGTSSIKIFDLTLATVGNNEKQLIAKNIPYWKTFIYGNSHASYYPNSSKILFKLLFSPKGKILGAQAIGSKNVEKRIDVISSIIRNNGTIYDMIDSELCYAPPYSSAKDPVNILGMNAENILKGLVKPAYIEDIDDNCYLIDVRGKMMYDNDTITNAHNVPIMEIRNRLDEIPKDGKVILFCNTGYTSYNASRILIQNGYNNVYSLMGGIELYHALKDDIKAKINN